MESIAGTQRDLHRHFLYCFNVKPAETCCGCCALQSAVKIVAFVVMVYGALTIAGLFIAIFRFLTGYNTVVEVLSSVMGILGFLAGSAGYSGATFLIEKQLLSFYLYCILSVVVSVVKVCLQAGLREEHERIHRKSYAMDTLWILLSFYFTYLVWSLMRIAAERRRPLLYGPSFQPPAAINPEYGQAYPQQVVPMPTAPPPQAPQ
ncbi:unnamed protein product [Vitrella brassicaformis CCMP3155]|uniref:MARVEL domain-containing protein n=1 Tax=Vitrella brassicaformis (strain CCMP3155) TaxID=1169540 RepID=A0A0G4FM80_VITBC|nr:unnamed protein product [Vitrella brassicaformis CCMP3155]|eukprot:CEM14657.1 unnamed protein product [Vitrella brassicaformis CCMP3155]